MKFATQIDDGLQAAYSIPVVVCYPVYQLIYVGHFAYLSLINNDTKSKQWSGLRLPIQNPKVGNVRHNKQNGFFKTILIMKVGQRLFARLHLAFPRTRNLNHNYSRSLGVSIDKCVLGIPT